MALLQALRQVARQQVARHAAPQSVQQLRCFAAPANQLQLIKELRERTGAPMTDVKTALQAAGWDLGEDAENVPHREEMMRNLARDCIGRPAPWDNCLPPLCRLLGLSGGTPPHPCLHPCCCQMLPWLSCAKRAWRLPTRRPRGTQQRGWWGWQRATAWRQLWRCAPVACRTLRMAVVG